MTEEDTLDEYDEYVDNHWAVALASAPEALVSVVDTKIARAELHERKRIVAIVKEVWESRCSPVMEPDECPVCWLSSSILQKIEEE